MTKVESAIMAAIAKHQPCAKRLIVETLHEFPPGTVDRCINKLAMEGKIVDHGHRCKGRWAIAGAEIELRVGKKKKDPPPPPTNVAPGRLVSKMDGVWVPPKTLLRQDAQDSNACMSLDHGVRKPYTGRPLTLGVRVK